ncbi:unnamed protein product, partial [Mesorhabditis belari]|uniref:Protein kinase domain-containing protein n=1 Tax=Mesorhabditis belari TaxID=2138241 RepID=A0AAF3JCD4_9BILA
MRNVIIWIEQLFDALHYIHEQELIHRDLKPDNILVTSDFVLKIADFGLVKETNVTCVGSIAGTHKYMSPPQRDPNQSSMQERNHKVSPRNDVYALGLTVWELIERRVVFQEYISENGFLQWELFCQIWTGEVIEIVSADCLDEIKRIVQSCVNFNRSERPTAERVLELIQAFKKAKGITTFDQPRIEEHQQNIIRPIGFNDLEDNEEIPVLEADLKKTTVESYKDLVYRNEYESKFNKEAMNTFSAAKWFVFNDPENNEEIPVLEVDLKKATVISYKDEQNLVKFDPLDMTPYRDYLYELPKLYNEMMNTLSAEEQCEFYEKLDLIFSDVSEKHGHYIHGHKQQENPQKYGQLDTVENIFRARLCEFQDKVLWSLASPSQQPF